ncbi:ribosome-associated chaperone zuotin [Encephalitozoon intestinalis ATCC 50506]|uniref:Ribosome-associated chaperone zuotin n=1 Tax=Encephalitozoon intestinalis (strain ATCC 50506) TaxID=876142 RepID=E0S5A2_ENCIT|nr:ribosome-associated chaperone zuotin [Encephalitozoon intestinalis ATCC 50506]ADM10887.1 ribosome-associated chaperone zuotin [Encephalitozoon intestinalis ATCC 50506]UTX44519.1 zuotin [Encephalitozoon intestinalis]
MANWIVKFEKPVGDLARIHEEYFKGRNVLNLYTKKELEDWGRCVDLYLLLDLDMYREKAIPPHILDYVLKAKMYEYHPDVTKGCREVFLLVKIAGDVFRNRKLRLFYDSSFFDESIPDDKIYQEDEFFDVFGECFQRNAKFSMKQPVPLMDRNEDSKKTEEFYEFWSNFKSWRTFEPVKELYNMGENDRQQYSIKNKEKLGALKNQDALRIKRLVQIAKKRDPRVGKSIEKQMEEMMKIKSWTPLEISTLSRLISLFGKSKKNKWEVITEKLFEITKIRRSVKEVMEKGQTIERR